MRGQDVFERYEGGLRSTCLGAGWDLMSQAPE